MATITILPDEDVLINWDINGETFAYQCLAYDVSAAPGGMDTAFVDETDFAGDFEIGFAAPPANLSQCTQIDLEIRGQIDDVATNARISVELTHTAGTTIDVIRYITGTDFGGYGTLGDHVEQFLTLTLNKTEITSLRVEVIFLET